MYEKVNLMWNSFQENISTTYKELREETAFTDVTLACDGPQSFKVHRLILSASSPVFNVLLRKHTSSHALIYLRGILEKDLNSLIDFMYHGEINVHEEDLDRFISLAEEFQIKGIFGKNQLAEYSYNETVPIIPDNLEDNVSKVPVLPGLLDESENIETQETKTYTSEQFQVIKQENTHEFEGQTTQETLAIYSDVDTLDMIIETMMKKTENGWACKMCEKVFAKKDILMKHTEKHIEGINHPCLTCGKLFKSVDTLDSHKSISHKESMTDISTSNNETLDKDSDEVGLEAIIATVMEKEEDRQELKVYEKVGSQKENLVKSAEKHTCTMCGKFFIQKSDAKRHILAKHSGLQQQVDCEFCGNTFKNKQSLGSHARIAHKAYSRQQQVPL